ncbi:MAG TPA: ABC transporter permease subunit [Candidatus Saccharimonadales bacterium]|nr:ABC transporter permease subunit [Candidatus Saccharimonadales bacterium]
MRPVVKWGLLERKWSIFWWIVGIGLTIALIVLVYPTFRNQSQLDSTLNNIPAAAKSLITDTTDFFSPEGYMSSQWFYLLLPLLLSILTIGMGSSLISKEEQSGTLELLLSRPVSRGRLLFGKAVVAIVELAIITVFSIAITVVCAEAVKLGISWGRLAEATSLAALLSLLFGSVAFMLNAMGRAGRLLSLGAATLIAFGSYLISSLAGVVHWLAWPAKVLPFHYYQPAAVMSGTYNWWYAAAFGGVILVLGFIAFIGFRRRDIG